MRANWIKIILFVLGAFMLAGIAQVLLDPGLGKPDESRRTKHPAGFSFVPPRGWGASVFYSSPGDPEDYLRVSPERSTGRQPSIGVTRSRLPLKPPADARPYTFQDQPAFLITRRTRNNWFWKITFERNGIAHGIALDYPVETDVEGGPLWPFIEGFRVEPVMSIGSASAPASGPATAPAITP